MSIDQIPVASGMGVEYVHRGTSLFKISPLGIEIGAGILGQVKFADGSAAAPSICFAGETNTGFYRPGAGVLAGVVNGSVRYYFTGDHLTLSDSYLSWNDDVKIYRDTANVLALKNGTNTQELRVYGTTTGNKYIGLKHTGTGGRILCDEAIAIRNKADDSWQDIQLGRITTVFDNIFAETATPAAPADGYCRVYAKDAGGGKTGLYVLFPTGAEQQIKVEA